MKKYFILICFLTGMSIYAQVNIEKYNKLSDKFGFTGAASFYLSAKTGNTDVQELGLDGRINYNAKNFYTFFIAQGEYGWNNGVQYSNNALFHIRYIHKLSNIWNPETYAQINYNKKRLLNFRSLVGAGIRATILSDTNRSFSVGTGIMFEKENLDLEYDSKHPRKTNFFRSSNYISYFGKISNNSNASMIIYIQPRFADVGDLRILSENRLGVMLTNRLSLSLNVILQFDNKPPDGVKNFDTNTRIGFTYSL